MEQLARLLLIRFGLRVWPSVENITLWLEGMQDFESLDSAELEYLADDIAHSVFPDYKRIWYPTKDKRRVPMRNIIHQLDRYLSEDALQQRSALLQKYGLRYAPDLETTKAWLAGVQQSLELGHDYEEAGLAVAKRIFGEVKPPRGSTESNTQSVSLIVRNLSQELG